MTVVGLHPEQLIDKLEAGALSSAERAQLDAHLVGCPTCRIELAMRSDFAADAPLAFPEHPELMLEAPEPEEPPARRPSTAAARRGRRRRLALLAVAVTLSASGALAALSNRQLPWRAWFGGAAPAASPPAVPRSASNKGNAGKKALAVGLPASTSVTPLEGLADPEASAVSSSEAAAPPSALTTDALPLSDRRAQRARPVGLVPGSDANAPSPVNSAIPSGRAEFPPIASGAAESTEAPASDAASLFAEASRARRDGNIGRAIALYHQLEHDYPSSPESQLSVALLAKIMLDRGDPAAAAADYDRYLHDGTPILSAEALVGRARALEQLGKLDDAAAVWREVQQRFPGSVHARLAATRLAALGGR